MKSPLRRQIPAVSKVLDALGRCGVPRPLVVEFVRRKLSEIRANSDIPKFESIIAGVHRSLDELRAGRLQPIVNGTGIALLRNSSS